MWQTWLYYSNQGLYVYSELILQFQKSKPEKETVRISREILSLTCLSAGNAFNCALKLWENKPKPIGIQWAPGLGWDPFSLVTKSPAEETLARGERETSVYQPKKTCCLLLPWESPSGLFLVSLFDKHLSSLSTVREWHIFQFRGKLVDKMYYISKWYWSRDAGCLYLICKNVVWQYLFINSIYFCVHIIFYG